MPLLSLPALYRLALSSDAGYAAAATADAAWQGVCVHYGLVRSRYDVKWLDTLARNVRQRAFASSTPSLWVPGPHVALSGALAVFTIQDRVCGSLRNTVVWKGRSVFAVITADNNVYDFAPGERNGVVRAQCASIARTLEPPTTSAAGPVVAGGAPPPPACKNGGTCRRGPLGRVVR